MGTQECVAETLKSQAYFISGKNSKVRKDSNLVKSAISDAKKISDFFRNDLPLPMISSGTTVNPKQVLMLTWTIVNTKGLQAISIACKGNGKYDVAIENEFWKNINYSNLLSLNIPTVYNKLQSQ